LSFVDLNKSVLIAARTGKVVLGSEKTIDAVVNGRGKLILVSQDCLKEKKERIANCAELSGLKVYSYPGSSFDLGEACGKPFAVAALVIREPGDSDILRLVEEGGDG
jgi:large subunit ribosomal protein L30e